MKTILGVILILIVILMMSGCSDEGQPVIEAGDNMGSNESFSYSESLAQISEQISTGAFLGKTKAEVDIPPEKFYMESEGAIGYDAVCLYETSGTVTMLLKEQKVIECTFGSKPFTEQNTFDSQLKAINKNISTALSLEMKEFSFICGDKSLDELEAVFQGKGILKVDYQTDRFNLTITAVGTNGEATISVSQQMK